MNKIATAQPAPALGQEAEQASEVALHQSSGPAENRFYREPEQPASGMLAIIARAASDPAVNVEKMQALLAMNERIEARHAQAEFAAAFTRLAGKLPTIKKDGSVAYEGKGGEKKTAFKFARWEDIMRAIKPDLDAEGFALTFKSAQREGGGLFVTGKLMHAGGHSEEATIPLPIDTSGGKNNLQGYGSTFSYGKRYTATMLLNIVTEGEDDDGVKGGQEFISDETVAAINAELVKRKVNVDAFLDFLEVKSVTEIQVKDLAKARNAIKVAKPRPPEELPQ